MAFDCFASLWNWLSLILWEPMVARHLMFGSSSKSGSKSCEIHSKLLLFYFYGMVWSSHWDVWNLLIGLSQPISICIWPVAILDYVTKCQIFGVQSLRWELSDWVIWVCEVLTNEQFSKIVAEVLTNGCAVHVTNIAIYKKRFWHTNVNV